MPREALSGLDEPVDGGGPADAGGRGLAVPQRRQQADRSLGRAGCRAGGARAPAAAEHHPLGQVDRHRSGGAGAAARSTATSRSGTTSRSTATGSSTTATSSSSISRPGGGRRSTGAPSASPTRTRRTSRGGGPAAATAGAAATPGSSPTRRSRAATRTDRTRRRSRPACRVLLPAARRRAHRARLDPFLGLGSSAVAAARSASTSSGSRWTNSTCARPCAGRGRAGDRRQEGRLSGARKKGPGSLREPGPSSSELPAASLC
jgi:hypothetical protein